jgi:hypothetical protein
VTDCSQKLSNTNVLPASLNQLHVLMQHTSATRRVTTKTAFNVVNSLVPERENTTVVKIVSAAIGFLTRDASA